MCIGVSGCIEKEYSHMKAKPGQGKWRLKGRGGKIPCFRKRPWMACGHALNRQCRVCGTFYKLTGEYGVIEKVRFIEV